MTTNPLAGWPIEQLNAELKFRYACLPASPLVSEVMIRALIDEIHGHALSDHGTRLVELADQAPTDLHAQCVTLHNHLSAAAQLSVRRARMFGVAGLVLNTGDGFVTQQLLDHGVINPAWVMDNDGRPAWPLTAVGIALRNYLAGA